MKTIIDAARVTLEALPRAVSGNGGHKATFRAACELARFGLPEKVSRELLSRWNGTHCDPPWSEGELDHKWMDAKEKSPPTEAPRATPASVRFAWPVGEKRERFKQIPASRPKDPPVPPRAPLEPPVTRDAPCDTPSTRFKRLQWSLVAGRVLNGDFDGADPATRRRLSAGLIEAGDPHCSYACRRLSVTAAKPVSGRQSWMPIDRLSPMFGSDARFVPMLRDSEIPLVRHQGVSLAATKSPLYRDLFLFADAAVALGGGLCSIEFRSDRDLELFLGVNPALESSLLWLPSKGGTLFLNVRGEYPGSAVVNTGSAEWRADGQLSVVWKDSFPVDLQELAYTNSAPQSLTFAEIHWPKHWLLPWEAPAPGPLW